MTSGDSLGAHGPSPLKDNMIESRALGSEAGEASADVRGDYRYTLVRTWNSTAEPLVFILLNPSTADASQDDPTIRRCIGFAKRWGFGGIVVVNLYAYRATKPRDMLAAEDPIGPENDRILGETVSGKTVVAAWGTNAQRERVTKVLQLIPASTRLLALEITKFGHPRQEGDLLGSVLVEVWSPFNGSAQLLPISENKVDDRECARAENSRV